MIYSKTTRVIRSRALHDLSSQTRTRVRTSLYYVCSLLSAEAHESQAPIDSQRLSVIEYAIEPWIGLWVVCSCVLYNCMWLCSVIWMLYMPYISIRERISLIPTTPRLYAYIELQRYIRLSYLRGHCRAATLQCGGSCDPDKRKT